MSIAPIAAKRGTPPITPIAGTAYVVPHIAPGDKALTFIAIEFTDHGQTKQGVWAVDDVQYPTDIESADSVAWETTGWTYPTGVSPASPQVALAAQCLARRLSVEPSANRTPGTELSDVSHK